MKIRFKLIPTLFFATLLAYLPLVLNPDKLLSRSNDLEEQFWPVFYFIRQKFWETHSLPLWNNLFLSGTPLLPDPQFSLFYPPNWLFILFPADFAFFIWFILHTFAGGIFFYYLTKNVFRFSDITSFVLAVLYITTPRLGAYLEAGHYGLVGTLTWLPLVVFSSYKLVSSKKLVWPVLLGISFSALFFLHTVTLVLAIVSSLLLVIVLSCVTNNNLFKISFRFTYAGIISLGLAAVTLFPQLEWLPQTTRLLLLQDRDVYPKWSSIIEFVTSSVSPLLSQNQQLLDTEKWLFIGIVPIILSVTSFLKLNQKYKILVAISLFVATLIATNNISPIYNIFLSQDWYVLQRVASRIWFVPTIIVLILSGIALEKLKQKKKLFFTIVTLAIFESVYISWHALNKPIELEENRFVPKEVYEFLTNDKEKFRVFCTTRCLSQKEAAMYGLELVEGYNTIQQINYYKHMWQLTGKYWNYYSLALPPQGSYLFEEIQPEAVYLGDFNTKYVIAPYQLTDKNFKEVTHFEKYKIFENQAFKTRAYSINENNEYKGSLEVTKYSPNEIIVNTTNTLANKVVLAEVYNSGWKAYKNGQNEIAVLEKPNTLRQVDIPTNTQYITFRYDPITYTIGKSITLVTLCLVTFFLLKTIKKIIADKTILS